MLLLLCIIFLIFVCSFFTGSKKKCWSFGELEAMNSTDVFAILDEIPSDCESIASDVESTMDNEAPIDYLLYDGRDELFDIEDIPFIFEDNEQAKVTKEWDSEDELPLEVIRQEELRKKSVVWTNDVTHATRVNQFVSQAGPNVPDNVETPTDMFLYLFPDCFISEIVFQTNLYALQKNGGSNYFIPTTNKEIKSFLGVNMLMSLKKMPSYRDYWSSREELRDYFISSVLSRDRFTWLLSNLHVNDNSVQPKKGEANYDKLYKIRPLLSKLTQTLGSALNPGEFQSIDESMIKFKGRSSLRQYMPMKPTKRGYKVWIRADSTGFVSEFQIYTGKVDQSVEKKLGHRVVKDLTRALVGKHHKVFFDNFFNCVELQRDLLADGIYACGTVRKGRKYYPELKVDKHMKRGDIDWRVSTDGLAALKWMDRRTVLFLGNYHDPSIMEVVSRKQKNGNTEEIPCPVMVKHYNKHMGYVDRFDMLKSIYEIDRKAHKWWHRIFFYFVDVCVVNAFILFQNRSDSRCITLKQFRVSVARGLIGAVNSISKKRRSAEQAPNKYKKIIPTEVRHDRAAHMPLRCGSLRCAHCSTAKHVHRTTWKCSTCDVGLCLNKERNCFFKFHEN